MMASISMYDFLLFVHVWTNSQHMQATGKLQQQGQVPQEEQEGQLLEDLAAKPVPRVQQMISLIEQLPPGA